jgi:hypothetical protein
MGNLRWLTSSTTTGSTGPRPATLPRTPASRATPGFSANRPSAPLGLRAHRLEAPPPDPTTSNTYLDEELERVLEPWHDAQMVCFSPLMVSCWGDGVSRRNDCRAAGTVARHSQRIKESTVRNRIHPSPPRVVTATVGTLIALVTFAWLCSRGLPQPRALRYQSRRSSTACASTAIRPTRSTRRTSATTTPGRSSSTLRLATAIRLRPASSTPDSRPLSTRGTTHECSRSSSMGSSSRRSAGSSTVRRQRRVQARLLVALG